MFGRLAGQYGNQSMNRSSATELPLGIKCPTHAAGEPDLAPSSAGCLPITPSPVGRSLHHQVGIA